MKEIFKSNIKYVGMIGIFAIVGASFIFGYNTLVTNENMLLANESADNRDSVDNVEDKASETKEEVKTMDKATSIKYYEVIHNMANTVIKSENIWQTEKITKEKIAEMIDIFKGYDDNVVKYLNEWNSLDFSNSVQFHNYVWDKLEGTIGKATGLNQQNINEVIEKLK